MITDKERMDWVDEHNVELYLTGELVDKTEIDVVVLVWEDNTEKNEEHSTRAKTAREAIDEAMKYESQVVNKKETENGGSKD